MHIKTKLGDAMLRTIPGAGGRLNDTLLTHGCAIFRGARQVASGYISDNAAWHAIELALNQNLLVELPEERIALLHWLKHQKQRFGGREPNTHQRGSPVDWFRIGFSSFEDALIFLSEFSNRRRAGNAIVRWAFETAGMQLAPHPVSDIVSSSSQSHLGGPERAPPEFEWDVRNDADKGDDGLGGHVGNRSNEAYALACIPILVDHVLRQTDDVMQQITYEELARRLGRLNRHGQPAARGMGVILGRAMAHIDRATAHLGTLPPYLTTVVVAKTGTDKGLPGVGVRERWHGYEDLTRAEKAAKIEAEYKRIMQFGSSWNDVLIELGLDSCVASESLPNIIAVGGWGGGESAEHKALKEFVRTHPELFGATDDDREWRATEEYALRSGDEVDVFFKSDSSWIGVEVKSSVSDANLNDYERGLYQVVKYRAVLEAQAKIDHPTAPPTIKVVLALDGALPPQLRSVAQSLEVRVVENLRPVARQAPLCGSSACETVLAEQY